MKKSIVFSAFMAMVSFSTSAQTIIISAKDANKHIGETVKITDKVFDSKWLTQSNMILLDIGGHYPDQALTVIISNPAGNKFKSRPDVIYNGKYVTVTGKLTDDKGKTEMVVTHPPELKITLAHKAETPNSYLYFDVLGPGVDTTINDPVTFKSKLGITDTLNLHSKTFSKKAFFNNDSIPTFASFYSTKFLENVDFDGTKFNNYADFSNDEFRKAVVLNRVKFRKIVFLSALTTTDSTAFQFYQAQLPELVDFSFNKNLIRAVDFTNANFDSVSTSFCGKDTRRFINIYNSDISKIKIDYLHFKLCFYDINKTDTILNRYLINAISKYKLQTKLDTIRVFNELFNSLVRSREFREYIAEIFPSLDLKDSLVANFAHFYLKVVIERTRWFPSRLSKDQSISLYHSLLNNFDSNGQKISYEQLDIDTHDFSGGVFNFFDKYWWNYGYSKLRIFLWSGIFVFFFALINLWNLAAMVTCYPIRSVKEIIKNDDVTNKPASLRKRTVASIYYTLILFFALKLNFDKIHFKGQNWSSFVLIQFTVGLVCTGFIIHLIIQ